MTPSWLPASGTAGVGGADKEGWGGGGACSLRAGPWLLTELLCHVADPEDLSQPVRTPALGDTGRAVALSEQDLMAAFEEARGFLDPMQLRRLYWAPDPPFVGAAKLLVVCVCM